jgi:anti-sigma B factor antagonist
MPLKIATMYHGEIAVLRCEGRIVLGEAPELRASLRSAWEGGAKRIVLDLTGVNYIDSSGIGELVSAYTTTRNSGGELVLAGLTKKVSDLLKITKLYTVFQVFETAETAEAAIASLGRAGSSQVRDETKT